MKVLKEFAKWKTGLAFLLGLGLAIWLNPLPASSIIVLFITCFAVVHLVAAIASALFKGPRVPKQALPEYRESADD